MSAHLDAHPYPNEPTQDGQIFQLSWMNDSGETIVVALDAEKAMTPDPQQAIRAFTVRHSDMDNAVMYPFITRFGDMFPKIRGADGEQYLLRDEEAGFIEHAVRTLLGHVTGGSF